MKRIQVAIILLGAMLVATSSAALQLPEECCACVIHFGTNEGPTAAIPALFCEAVLGEAQRVDFETRCSDRGGGTTCESPDPGLLPQDNVDCSALLLELDQIDCPEGAPVPLLGTGVLGALALGLAGLGAWAVRRRSAARSQRQGE